MRASGLPRSKVAHTRALVGGLEQAVGGDEHRDRERHRCGHPHDPGRELLVGERGQPTRAMRERRVGAVERCDAKPSTTARTQLTRIAPSRTRRAGAARRGRREAGTRCTQKSSAVPKKSACSRSCTAWFRSVRSNSAGRCHASSMPLKSDERRQRRGEPAKRAADRASAGPASAAARAGAASEGKRPRRGAATDAREQERRRDHHQQHVLHHVHPEELVGVRVDRRVDRGASVEQPAVEARPPSRGRLSRSRRPPMRIETPRDDAASGHTSGQSTTKQEAQL